MNDTIKVICENLGTEIDVPMGTPLSEVAKRLTPGRYPFLAAFVNNRLKELSYKIYAPVTIRFVDVTSFAGIRVYQRTAWFLLQKAVKDLYPGQTLHIRHSMGQSGFYCEIDGIDEFTAEDAARLQGRMRELSVRNLPITRQRMLTTEVRARYAEEGFTDKIALLDTRPRLYSQLYTLDDTAGYFYGSLAPSTGYIDRFCIEPYYKGFYLALPLRTNPGVLNKNVQQEKMFGIFQEYQSWVRIMGVPTVGDVNSKVLAGDGGGLIKLAEAFHERKFAWVADTIYDAHLSRGARMVLISGPSSSGKTTSAKRLGIQLGVLGLNPVLISLDDYFVDRDKTPLDAQGDYDYESLYALNLELFNKQLLQLFAGEEVELPRYNFQTGRSEMSGKLMRMEPNDVLVVEGIHALNPELTAQIDEKLKYRVYASALTTILLDEHNYIPTTDNRLLRRIVRDYKYRGCSARDTIRRWPSVRAGENKWIFPYQENADTMFNTAMIYELAAIKTQAEPLLEQVPENCEEYAEAYRLRKFLSYFNAIDHSVLPPTSLLREFLGGSSFTY